MEDQYFNVTMLIASILIGLIGTILIHTILFGKKLKKKYKSLEDNLIESAGKVLEKMDALKEQFESNGGNKMDADLKRVAEWLDKRISKNIEDAKEEIITRVEDILNEMLPPEEAPGKEDGADEDDLGLDDAEDLDLETENSDIDDYDKLDDYEGKRKIDTKAEAKKIKEEQEAEGKKKKKGFFGLKKKK